MNWRLFLLLPACTAAVLGAAERPLVIDKGYSHIEVEVKATVDSFTGRLADYDAAVTIDEATGGVTAARLDFRFADLKTGKEKRDAKMHEWQDTPHHSDGSFRLGALEVGPDGRTQARGQLTFHGVTRELVFPIMLTNDGARHAVDGEAVLDTRDFGLPVIRLLGLLKVDPCVTVRFHLQGMRQGD